MRGVNMNQNVKFRYEDKFIVFFISWRGAHVEVLRAKKPIDGADMLPELYRLKNIAKVEAMTLLMGLKQKAA